MSRFNNEEYIKDFQSRRSIGILRTLKNGDIEARDFISRRILGYYRKSLDATTDFYGRKLAKGNCVVGLIYNYHNKMRNH
jgi:hypothetical protein